MESLTGQLVQGWFLQPQPLLLSQHEALRADANEVVGEDATKEGDIAVQLGRGSRLPQFL